MIRSEPAGHQRGGGGSEQRALAEPLLQREPPEEAGGEGRVYREIGRSKPAPQGICIINSAGKVLAWSLMFDDDQSVIAFLDHCVKRYTDSPDAQHPVAAERYFRFPSQKMNDLEDTGQALRIPQGHAHVQDCCAKPRS